MVMSIDALSTPVGTIEPWLRQDSSIPLPYGWLICDGSTVSDSNSAFNGKAIPDLRAKFSRGHNSLDNSNFASDTFYYAGGTVPTGGADSVNLNHSHPLSSHTHTYSVATSAGTSIGGVAGGPTAQYLAVATHAHSFSGTTGSASGTSNTALGGTENRPPFVETVTIIKVK